MKEILKWREHINLVTWKEEENSVLEQEWKTAADKMSSEEEDEKDEKNWLLLTKENWKGPDDLYNKIRKRGDFQLLNRKGVTLAGKYYLFSFLPSADQAFAVIASKRVGKAVKRNYEKRLARNFINQHASLFPSVKCLVIRLPKREGSYHEKASDFLKTMQRMERKISKSWKFLTGFL